MPNYTTNLNLAKPLQDEQYDIDVFNANADKIDNFAGQIPARSLTADKLTTGAKINNVLFKGDTNITLPVATNSVAGTIKPDNDSILIDENGVIRTAYPTTIDFVNNSKALETGAVSDNAVIYPWIEDMAHSTFDLSKFIVVGTPTITSDGIASNFSSGNYIELTQQVEIGAGKSWKVKWSSVFPPVQIGNIITNYFTVGRNNTTGSFICLLYLYNADTESYGNSILSIPDVGASYVGKKYEGLVSYDGINTYTFKLKFEDGEEKSTTITTTNYIVSIKLHIGGGDFNEQFDLKQFSITVDGVDVFSGNKTGIDTIKPDDYTVVGSPTITADGVASGFSGSNYITIPNLNETVTDLEIYIKFNTGNIATESTYSVFGRNDKLFPRLNIGWNSNALKFMNSPDGTNWGNTLNIAGNLNANTDYWLEITLKNGTLKSRISSDGINYTESSVSCSAIIMTGIACIGTGESPFVGSFDLNSFKIYVDGYLVYQPCLKIPYTESATGSKIVDMAYLDRVKDVYEYLGYAPYFTIDETNQTFTLPMGEIYGMTDKKISALKTETTTALAGKANTGLDNVTDTGKIKMANAPMPSGTYTDLTLGADETTYTAPADGYFALEKVNGSNVYALYTALINLNNGIASEGRGTNKTDSVNRVFVPVSKGDVVQYRGDTTGAVNVFRFVYANGSTSEYSAI